MFNNGNLGRFQEKEQILFNVAVPQFEYYDHVDQQHLARRLYNQTEALPLMIDIGVN
ncbi:hypothetical protein GCM10022209_10340 [Chitinophaga oryziterrae]